MHVALLLAVVLSAQAGVNRAVDPTRSQVVATGSKITGSHVITFPGLRGSVTYDGGVPASLDLSLSVADLLADPPPLHDHLQSADFFDVLNHPQATFRSTSLRSAGPDGSLTVEGDLTLRGQTQHVRFPATVQDGPSGTMATARFTIRRKDYGIVYPGMPDNLIQDEVPLVVTIVVPK